MRTPEPRYVVVGDPLAPVQIEWSDGTVTEYPNEHAAMCVVFGFDK